MANKAVLGGFAAILLVAAVVGVVAGVLRSHGTTPSNGSLPTTSKSVEAICAPTIHQEVCQQTLGSSLNGSIEPKDIVQATINATMEQVRVAFEHSSNLSQNISDPKNKMAIDECKRLLNDAMDDLHAVLQVSHNFEDLLDRSNDIKVWLNAVISYQVACTENFDDQELKTDVQNIVTSVVQFASNALSLFKEYSSTLSKGLAVDLNTTLSTSRRLMGSEDGFPSWFSAADRRMLRGRGGASVQVRPNVVVAKDGSGNFNSINAALAAMPAKYEGRYVIYVKAGVYDEHVVVDRNKPNVYMYGDGSRKTMVTGKRSNVGGYATSESATFIVLGLGFIAKSMGFSNTAGPENHQAVALRVQGDMSAFFNCRLDASQDTLYVQSNRQFYRNCVVSGTVDFIFGDSYALLQNCLLILRHPMNNQQNIVTAMGRTDPSEETALVIQNCRIVPDQKLFPDRFTIKSYLGRPWKNYARTIFMENEIGDVIQPAGYMDWPGNNMNLPYYGEYANRGPGAVTTGRVKWPGVKVISRQEAAKYTAGVLLESKGPWLQNTGEIFFRGFKN